MIRGIGMALLAVGIALIIWGANAGDSAASHVSNFFNGTPTNKTIALLGCGIASAIIGAVMIFRGSKA